MSKPQSGGLAAGIRWRTRDRIDFLTCRATVVSLLMMEERLIETWQIHDRINLYLLDAVPDEALESAIGKSRMVSDLFAHVHNVRLLWLKSAATDLLKGLEKLETKTVHTKNALRSALESSGEAIAVMLRRSFAADGKIKGFKPHAVAFLGYLIAHESHHRGHIGWALKHSGYPLDPKTAFGLWEWGVR